MTKYFIKGGKKICGEIKIQGAKNSVLPILAACILNYGEITLKNCPEISDVDNTLKILELLGCKIIREKNILIINSRNLDSSNIPENLACEMRSSIVFMGSLLSRNKKVIITKPGGCKLGDRPIDLHIDALIKMGANIKFIENKIICVCDKLKGCVINLKFASVGATQNIILAACLANGMTKIINAAREPEIIDLQNFLVKMGAKVYGAGTNEIYIFGVKNLSKNFEYKIMPDRIIASSYLVASAITKGDILINNITPAHLPLNYFLKIGCMVKIHKNKVFLQAPENIKPIDYLETDVYPGFPTDLQSQFLSLLSVANGKSIIKEKIFNERYKNIFELKKINADIKISEDKKKFIINGVKNLKSSNNLITHDLRGGVGLVLVSLFIKGECVINDEKDFIKRGHENIVRDLNKLSADIKILDK
ncbi:MAG: UDP-N-acetylglucosamine 1-carboxyvinyltransferase [Clostridiales bacterium]|jgi:UDP-N-acetylglucosamine 1-carboxyvinyltransferase|nr:UDP-N-acetylglucosamine 1-carboxyvinyltransferase [Clostridiales bacterium]